MQRIKNHLVSKGDYYLVALCTSIIIIICNLVINKGLKFENSLEYKDILSFVINLIFIFFVSKALTKTYDSERKKKDLMIDEIKFVYNLSLKSFENIKNNSYNSLISVREIDYVRSEFETIKQILNDSFEKIDLAADFNLISRKLRSIDRIINPPAGFSSVNQQEEILIMQYEREIRKQIYIIIEKVNKA